MTDSISEQWLIDSGFKYYQEERQTHKHWQLWLGWGNDQNSSCIDDIGIELTMAWWPNRNGEKIGNADGWNCWIISHSGMRKHVHVRHLRTKAEVIKLVEAITGVDWDPSNHMYGNCYYAEMAKRLKTQSH